MGTMKKGRAWVSVTKGVGRCGMGVWVLELTLVGIGYRVSGTEGGDLSLELGYNHSKEVKVDGIQVEVDKQSRRVVKVGEGSEGKVKELEHSRIGLRRRSPYTGAGVRPKGYVVKLKPTKGVS